jgi:hypothetical protein
MERSSPPVNRLAPKKVKVERVSRHGAKNSGVKNFGVKNFGVKSSVAENFVL